MRFRIMAVSDDERRKAATIYNYSPEEYEVDRIDVDSEQAARRLVARRVKKGTYPEGSMAVPLD